MWCGSAPFVVMHLETLAWHSKTVNFNNLNLYTSLISFYAELLHNQGPPFSLKRR